MNTTITTCCGPGRQRLAKAEVRERMLMAGPRSLTDGELLDLLGGEAAARETMAELAWLTVSELRRRGLPEGRAVALAAAFELGRRGAWAPPRRGERCLDPGRVYELMRPLAYRSVEEFHVVLLDVRGRLLKTERVGQGSLAQCPVAPADVFRAVLKEAAHSVVFVHNHPSSDPAPSACDCELTARLRAAADIVGVVARDHVIVASQSYFSFVEAGRWR